MTRETLPPLKQPRSRQRGTALVRLLAPLLLVLLALALAMRGNWPALLILPLVVWMLMLPPEVEAPRPPPARSATGKPHRLLHKLLPLWSAHIDTAERRLGEGMAELLVSLQQILVDQERLSQALQAEPPQLEAAAAAAADLNPQIEAALHALQVGDRVHQMLEVVKADQLRLESQLAQLDGMEEPAVDRWLAELASHYTTDEQRFTHGADPASAGTQGVQYF